MKIISPLRCFTWVQSHAGSDYLYYLTICAEGIICWADGAGEQHPLQAPIRWVYVQLGQGDRILDDRWDIWRRGRQIARTPSWPRTRSLAHMPKGACEESCCFGAARWVWTSWLPDASVVAEEGSVAKHIPATTDVHGVAEISQRWADHVHREVALEATFPLRARHKAFNPWQLSKTHSGKEKLRNFPLKFEWKRLDSDYTSVKSEIQFGVHWKKKKEGKIEKPGQRGERTEICGRSVSRECVYNQFSIQSQPAIHPLPAPGVLLHLHSKMPKWM